MKRQTWTCCLFTLAFLNASFERMINSTIPVSILDPVASLEGARLTAAAADGKVYPVFKTAGESQPVRAARAVLDASFTQQVLRLGRCA